MQFDLKDYLDWSKQQQPSTTSTTAPPPPDNELASHHQSILPSHADGLEPRYPSSFFELCQMIQRGDPIPGIRQIPNKIISSTPAPPKLTAPKKPWEASTTCI